MISKLRILLGGCLLSLSLTLNAHAFTTSGELAGLDAPQQQSGWCWFYYMGRWIQFPC